MEYDDEKKDKLNKLEGKLYSRNTPNIIDAGRTDFKEENKEVKDDWQDVKASGFDELAAKMSQVAQSKHNFVNKIFTLSLVFFVIVAGVATFVFLGGGNTVSSKNVDIQVSGPLSVPGGQEVSFDINIINNNNTDLNAVSLLIEYPAGVRSSVDLSKELDREKFALDNIKSKDNYRQNIKIVFFGEKDSLKQIKISLEYRVANSSALFYKEKIHDISISSAPIIITPVYPKEVNSNQEISFEIEVVSNSKDQVSNFLVNVEYPFGFVFKSASPQASFGNNIWKFASLNSGEKRKIVIKGSIIGQNNEERVFRISAGTASGDDERVIAVPLSELTESILVKKPFIGLDVLVDGRNSDMAVEGGRVVNTTLSVRNNLSSRLFNVSVEALLKGGAFDELSVVPRDGGFFQSSNDTILWDKRSVSEFTDMEPGALNDISFYLSPLKYSQITLGAKPEVEMVVKVFGERILEAGMVEKVSITETRKIILTTDVTLESKVFRSVGNLENSGPIPPKVNIPTTYNIFWDVKNSFNQVSNVEMRATLPPYVQWTSSYSPSNEIVSLDTVTNEVVWKIGSLLPNTGFGSSKKELYFQLEILPSSSQIGTDPIILGGATFSGIDKVTGLRIEKKAPAVTTNFSSDPTFKTGDDRVVQ